MLPEFDFLSPRQVEECLSILADRGPESAPIAGGTNLVVDLRIGRARPRCIVDLSRLGHELAYIRQEDGHVAIGACTTVADVLRSPLLATHGVPLVRSAQVFASPLIRNRATVGGNLADASPAADLAPPLLALGAEVVLRSRQGERVIPLEEFFQGPRQTQRRPDELLVAIRYPMPGATARGTFLKLGLRDADAISVVSVACMVEQDGDVCRTVRIALGAVAPTPIRAPKAEAALVGQPLTEETARAAAAIAATEARPIDDIRGTAEYRRWMVEVLLRRALLMS